jgi:long-chain acyl-CoA synthetase
MLSHRSLITALLNAIIAYDVRQTDSHLYSFPMCHVAGYLITQHHLMGASVVLQRAFEAGKWLERVEKYGCTTGGLAPTMMNFVLQHPKLDEHDTDTMRSLLYGAAAMPVELLKRAIARFGPVVCSGFGMTELGGNVLYHPKSDHVRATKGEEHLLAACGIPMAFAAVKVVDENMNECPPREVGEIVVKGEQLLKGYWNRAEATEEAFKGGWFHSGDMAWRDEEGFFYIVDRMKDMIITGGENVYSREVEEVIYVHTGVSEAAIIGLPDEVWGERVVAVVAMKQGIEGGEAVAAEIIKTCRERLAGYKCPKQVFFIGELPKNVSGKILKRELRDQFAG